MEVVPSWVVQVPADRVLAVEGLDGPAVGGPHRRLMAEDPSLREFGTSGGSACGGRSGERQEEHKGRDEDGGGGKSPATPDMCGGGVHAATVGRRPNGSVTPGQWAANATPAWNYVGCAVTPS